MEFENHIEQVNMEDCYSASPPLTTKALLDSMPDEELMAHMKALSTIVPSVSPAELSHYVNNSVKVLILPKFKWMSAYPIKIKKYQILFGYSRAPS